VKAAAKGLEFELAAILRDEIRELKVRATTTATKEKKPKKIKKTT
jgi:protein-arginine kinase activator protein McsA